MAEALSRAGVPSKQLPDLLANVRHRKKIGLESYGTPLTAFNGRDGCRDALDESIDLCVYLDTGRTEGWCPPRVFSKALSLLIDVHALRMNAVPDNGQL